VIEFFEILPDGKRDSLGTETFTMEMAQRANLTTNPSWKKFPEAMLWARCLTAGVRARCPDALGGTPAYSIEEMNPKIEVDEDGIPIPDAEVSEAAPSGVSDKLRELMSLTKTPEKKLLKHYSVESLEDLSAQQQADAISVLESKLAAN